MGIGVRFVIDRYDNRNRLNVEVIAMKGMRLREIRKEMLLSKAELARRAGISPLTVARIEKGYPFRISTMRKILNALGLDIKDKDRVFGE